MIKFDDDKQTEEYLRWMSKLFVSSMKQLQNEEAEQLAYEFLKFTYVAKEAVRVLKKRKKNKKGGR